MLRWLSILGALSIAAVGAFTACSLEDSLENAPCETDDDCLGDYTCVLTSGSVGYCRNDGKCAAGLQPGCQVNGSGGCDDFTLSVACDVSGAACFCCEGTGTDLFVVNVSDDGSTAMCVSGDIENSPCDDDSSCVEGFSCVRTLEQEAEDAETLPEEQAQEDGFCRPSEPGTCAAGEQEGCKVNENGGCPGSGLVQKCTDAGRCYCCGTPEDNSRTAHVYADASDGSSAACVACPDCPDLDAACTQLEDEACVPTGSGPCGCV